ncbi:hypothetical protein DWQ65_11915 [Treponema phagedenis]|nr:hypothetical protein FUT83_10595 [Treponema phagedenis]QEK09826.1 hypothetical protein FUT81_10510 [Treponema phagedenis]QSH94235.1 hypothetical protein C5O78_04105 [Treponema phagedenis]QSI00750.1 hypothetical protein DWQ65_11915 [Treponema phagedenis]
MAVMSSTRRNGEQFTIGMLKSAVPYCCYSDLYNRKLITKRYTGGYRPLNLKLTLVLPVFR